MLTLTNDKLHQFEKAKDIVKPFWNSVCQELSDSLWLPEKKYLNKNTVQFQINQSIHSFVRKTSHESFPVFNHVDVAALNGEKNKKKKATKSRRKEVLPENVVIATRKIRFYPKKVQEYYDMCSVFRRGYNLAVEYLNSQPEEKLTTLCQCQPVQNAEIEEKPKKKTDYCHECGKYKSLRAHVCAKVEKECQEIKRVYNCNVVQESVDSAKSEFSKVCSQNKALAKNPTGEKHAKLKFKSSKETQQTFALNKMPMCVFPCVSTLGKIKLTENVPEEAIGQHMKVTVEYGRWYLLAQCHITLSAESQGKVRCLALDPGVRNFMTGYSESEVFFAGQNMQAKLLPLALKARKLIGQKQKLENIGKTLGNTFAEKPLWFQQRWTYLNRQLDRVKVKKANIIQTLHHEVAHYIVSHYDVIFLPTYQTQRMSAKRSRNVSKSTVVTMLALCHYQFKLTLKWYAKKYGKRVIDVNESYTSKTDCFGRFHEDLKDSDVIRAGNIVLDRDVNGARNIYIKHISLLLSRGLPRRADFITTNTTHVVFVAK